MSALRDTAVLEHAALLGVAEEGFAPYAFPDPRSPMARKLGVSRAWQVGQTGEVPLDVAALSGAPWTIGYGDTGPHVKRGLRWTRNQAISALEARLVQFQREARRTWPGIERLDPRAEAVMVDVAYNRGTDLTDRGRKRDPKDRRREMRELVPAIAAGDYVRIAALLRSMKRIWAGESMDGLLKRCESRALLIEQCLTPIQKPE